MLKKKKVHACFGLALFHCCGCCRCEQRRAPNAFLPFELHHIASMRFLLLDLGSCSWRRAPPFCCLASPCCGRLPVRVGGRTGADYDARRSSGAAPQHARP